MPAFTIYEVYSAPAPYTEERIHGLRLEWNAPGNAARGAVQLRDRIYAEYYLEGTAAYVGIRERQVQLREEELACLFKQKEPPGA